MNLTVDLAPLNSSSLKYSWRPLDKPQQDRLISFLLALLLHAVILSLGGMAFVKQAEYGIESSKGGMDIYLVAALPKESSEGIQTPVQPILGTKDTQTEITIPKPLTSLGSPDSAQRSNHLKASEDPDHHGDGSSPVPGLDPTTFYSSGGPWTEEKAGHLRNPAPLYPETAIELGQEGLVILSVLVDRTGRPQKVEVKQSSGFILLDKSAVSTVKKWRFDPGRVGMLTYDSRVVIPIRFQIEEHEKQKVT